MRKPAFILTSFLVTFLALPHAQAVEIFGWNPLRPFSGTKPAPQPTVSAPTTRDEALANDQLRAAETMENSGDLNGAKAAYKAIIRTSPLSAAASKAQFQTAKLLEKQGDPRAAFAAYKSYCQNYPRGGDFDASIQAQFSIATAYLGGQKKKVLGIPVGPSFERAEEMFRDIVKIAPFHKLAPRTQFNIGQALEKQSQPTEALLAYQEVISRYPGDPVADDAHYQMGYVKFRETKEGSRDQTARTQARDTFEDFVNRYPESEKTAQAKENIKSLGGADVQGTHDIAKFYDKTKNYKAAAVYYNEVIRIAPGTPESDLARKRIGELRSIAGADILKFGSENPQTGDTALARRRALARVDVASRPDYAGPLVKYPSPPANPRPSLRTSPLGPIVEPALPAGDPLQGTEALPPLPGDPLTPTLPTPPSEKPTNTPPPHKAEKAEPTKKTTDEPIEKPASTQEIQPADKK